MFIISSPRMFINQWLSGVKKNQLGINKSYKKKKKKKKKKKRDSTQNNSVVFNLKMSNTKHARQMSTIWS